VSLGAEARFIAGIDEFNQGNYFEAHEEWEAVWLDLVGTEKTLCQGLVQIAAGYHKLSLGGVNGARKLLERGLALLQNSDSARTGLSLASFCAGVAADLDQVRRLPFGATADLGLVDPPRLSRPS
jgi:predicted metal-dependent hydrolase